MANPEELRARILDASRTLCSQVLQPHYHGRYLVVRGIKHAVTAIENVPLPSDGREYLEKLLATLEELKHRRKRELDDHHGSGMEGVGSVIGVVRKEMESLSAGSATAPLPAGEVARVNPEDTFSSRFAAYGASHPEFKPFVDALLAFLELREKRRKSEYKKAIDEMVHRMESLDQERRDLLLSHYLGLLIESRQGQHSCLYGGGANASLYHCPYPLLTRFAKPFAERRAANGDTIWLPYFSLRSPECFVEHLKRHSDDEVIRDHLVSGLAHDFRISLLELPGTVLADPHRFKKEVEIFGWAIFGRRKYDKWLNDYPTWVQHSTWWLDYNERRGEFEGYPGYLSSIGQNPEDP